MAGNRIDMKNVVLFLKSNSDPTDYAPNPDPDHLVYLILQFGEGNFTWSMNDAIEYIPDRGKLDDVRSGDETPMDVSFEGKYDKLLRPDYSGAPYENLTVAEIIKGVNFQNTADHGTLFLAGIPEPWLAFQTSGESVIRIACPPYCCELELHNNPKLQCGNIEIAGEAQLFRYFRADSVSVDTRAGQISVSGKAHIKQPVVQHPEGGFDYTAITDEECVPLDDWVKDPRDTINS